jgi:hypothetical protein
VWGLILAAIGTGLALWSLGWNIRNARRERRERKVPDVYAVMAMRGNPAEPSELAFVNAGRGVARSVQFLYVAEGRAALGGFPFLLPEQAVTERLTFRATEYRSNFVWAYMDVDGRVYARSNDGTLAKHPPGAAVSLRGTFAAMYPDVILPDGRDLFVGE